MQCCLLEEGKGDLSPLIVPNKPNEVMISTCVNDNWNHYHLHVLTKNELITIDRKRINGNFNHQSNLISGAGLV